VASGRSLQAGGPASLLICFSLIGMMLYCTVHALGELAVLFPVAGSFSAYSTRFIDPVSLTFTGAKLPIPDCIRTSSGNSQESKFPILSVCGLYVRKRFQEGNADVKMSL
jgi:hypothetical protein